MGQLAETFTTEDWRQWQGKTVNGEFPLRRYLGGSARSAVFLTEYDDREPQPAAIKLIDANSPDAERQLKSWEIAATLSHPNLIRLFQMGHCGIGDRKFLYVVMECADEDLSQIVPQRALTEIEATEMMRPVLDALRYLHAEGWTHGHIKPSNIMARGDRLRLSADGLRDPGERISEPGSYDPPENSFSPGGDVWSLGMTLVEVLTRHLPVWERNDQGEPNVPDTLPEPLLDIARQCLRRDLRRRRTVIDIANRLNPPVDVRKIDQGVQLNGSRPKSQRWIAASILFLALSSVIFFKLRTHTSNAGTMLSHETEIPVGKIPSQPRQVLSVASTAKKEITPIEKENSVEVSPTPVHARLAEAPIVPAASGAEAADAGVNHRVLPNLPEKARATIRGTVRVSIKVSVDDSGNVTDAAIDSPGPSPYFANLALQAARQWTFAPARNGASNWAIRFNLSNSGTETSARNTTP